jgi:hypothetical protein
MILEHVSEKQFGIQIEAGGFYYQHQLLEVSAEYY